MIELRRSAQHLARASASRMDLPAVAGRILQFARLTAVEHACKLMRGDLLVQLVDGDGLRPIDIARATGLRPSDLSQMYATAKAFPRHLRSNDVPYNQFLLAWRMMRKFPVLRLTPRKALAQIRQLELTQHRDVTRHFSQLARSAEVRRAPLLIGRRRNTGMLNQVYHARFQDLLHRIEDGSAKLIHVDPPYVYPRNSDGRYISGSARSQACDNSSANEAIALVMDLLRDWQPKLASGGALLLWQASGSILSQISYAVERYKWAISGPIIWDKGRPQPGALDSPYSRQTEMLWVLSRPDDRLVNHDGSSRSDILRFSPVSFPSAAGDQDHCFEKPQKLCEFLVRKHTHEGELVLDLCGCTGSMSLAAIATKRNWLYVESNLENYRLGSSRIANRVGGRRRMAS